MSEPLSSEQPLYILPQQKTRTIIPKLFAFLFLGIIFYFGVLLNISLLTLSLSTENTIKLISLIILSLVVILGIIFNIRKSKQKYFFYKNKITFRKKEILIPQITDIKSKQDFLDKIFKTYSLNLDRTCQEPEVLEHTGVPKEHPVFNIKNIPQQTQLRGYIQKLITYSRSQTTY